MATKPTPHTSVSNQPEEAAIAIKKAVPKPPAEGIEPKTVKPVPTAPKRWRASG